MAKMPYEEHSYTTPKGILMFPDGYQGFAQTFTPGDTNAKTVDGRSVIPAGTIWPSNDANAKGVVLYDVDVTKGSATGTLLFVGAINVAKCPAAPAANAKTALPRITWFGGASSGTTQSSVTLTGLTAPVKDAAPVAASAVTSTAAIVMSLGWAPEIVGNQFAASTVYTATLEVVPKPGNVFADTLTVTATGGTATAVVEAGGMGATISVVFPATGA